MRAENHPGRQGKNRLEEQAENSCKAGVKSMETSVDRFPWYPPTSLSASIAHPHLHSQQLPLSHLLAVLMV